jgi:hypothetical protein
MAYTCPPKSCVVRIPWLLFCLPPFQFPSAIFNHEPAVFHFPCVSAPSVVTLLPSAFCLHSAFIPVVTRPRSVSRLHFSSFSLAAGVLGSALAWFTGGELAPGRSRRSRFVLRRRVLMLRYLHFAPTGQAHTSRGQRPRINEAKYMSLALKGRHRSGGRHVARGPVAPFRAKCEKRDIKSRAAGDPSPKASRNETRRASNRGFLEMTRDEYLKVRDWAGHQ